MSSTSQTRPRALAHCNTASFPKEPCSFLLDIPSPFLLGLSLLKGPCSQRMYQVASTESCRRFKPPSPSLGVLGRSKGRLPGLNCSSVRCMGEPISICYVCGCSMRPDQLMQRNARRLGSERECFQSRLSHCSFRRGEVREVSRIIPALPFPAPFILPIITSLEEPRGWEVIQVAQRGCSLALLGS